MTNEPAAGVTQKVIPPINSAFDYFIYHVVSNTAFDISMAILLVGVVALFLQFRMFKSQALRPHDHLKTTAIILIITFSMALGGFLTDEDLKAASPIFAIFGTIAGYLLGSAQRQADRKETDAHDQN